MGDKHINTFIKAVENVLGQFGIAGKVKGTIETKEEMSLEKDVTAFVGLIGEIRGNISYSFSSETAMNLVSAMMMGMPVASIGEMERSAIAELANMITGSAILEFNTEKVDVDITPPSVVMGEDVFFIIGTVTTLVANIETGAGDVEVNFGLET